MLKQSVGQDVQYITPNRKHFWFSNSNSGALGMVRPITKGYNPHEVPKRAGEIMTLLEYPHLTSNLRADTENKDMQGFLGEWSSEEGY